MIRINNQRLLLGVFGLGCLLALMFGWLYGAGHLGSKRTDLKSDRSRYENVLRSVRAQRKELPELTDRQEGYVAQTLGGNLEAVDSTIRSRLYTLGETAGLVDLKVNTPSSSAKGSPAKRVFKRSGTQRELREEIDFIEVVATISGEGTYEQVIRLLGWLSSDGWIKRVNQVRFDPNPDGSRVAVSIRLTTIFLPNQAPEELPASGEVPADRMAAILRVNPFRIPPPPAPKPPPPQPKPTPPAQPVAPVVAKSFPYDQWLVTGVVLGPDGPEAWLRNASTNERRTLQEGGSIGKAVLLKAQGEEATFELGKQTFEVQIGRSIAAGRDTSR